MSRYDFKSVRILRKQKKLTIRQLADRCGLTSPTVVSIETNKSAPSLDTLDRIAEALDLTTTSLLLLCQPNSVLKSAARTIPIADLRLDAVLESYRRASFGKILISRLKGQAGMYTDSNQIHGDVFEINYVLSGRIELTVEQNRHVLQQDETVFFDGLSMHRHRFLTDGEVMIFLIPKDQIDIHTLMKPA